MVNEVTAYYPLYVNCLGPNGSYSIGIGNGGGGGGGWNGHRPSKTIKSFIEVLEKSLHLVTLPFHLLQ